MASNLGLDTRQDIPVPMRHHHEPEAGQAGEPIYTLAMLRPMLAGAQARGMADALDLMGIGAILMDRTGMVLQANKTALGVLGKGLRLTNRHLVARDASQTKALQDMIRVALEGTGNPGQVLMEAGEASGRWIVEARALPPGKDESEQLLRAIVVLRKA